MHHELKRLLEGYGPSYKAYNGGDGRFPKRRRIRVIKSEKIIK